jgi:hypothetical protein
MGLRAVGVGALLLLIAGVGGLWLAGQDVMAFSGSTTTYEGVVTLRYTQDVEYHDGDGFPQTATSAATTVGYAGGEVTIDGWRLYRQVREGDPVRVDIRDRDGRAVALRGDGVRWRSRSLAAILLTALSLLVLAAAALLVIGLVAYQQLRGGRDAPV